jgi:hypothetical protein
MKWTKEPKKVPRNRGDSETSSLAHRNYHLPTYFLEGGEFCAFGGGGGGGEFCAFVAVGFVQLCVVLSVNLYWNLALSLQDATSRWLQIEILFLILAATILGLK